MCVSDQVGYIYYTLVVLKNLVLSPFIFWLVNHACPKFRIQFDSDLKLDYVTSIEKIMIDYVSKYEGK